MCTTRLLFLAALMGADYPFKLLSKPFQVLTFLAHSLALWPLPVCIRAAVEMPGKTEEQSFQLGDDSAGSAYLH